MHRRDVSSCSTTRGRRGAVGHLLLQLARHSVPREAEGVDVLQAHGDPLVLRRDDHGIDSQSGTPSGLWIRDGVSPSSTRTRWALRSSWAGAPTLCLRQLRSSSPARPTTKTARRTAVPRRPIRKASDATPGGSPGIGIKPRRRDLLQELWAGRCARALATCPELLEPSRTAVSKTEGSLPTRDGHALRLAKMFTRNSNDAPPLRRPLRPRRPSWPPELAEHRPDE